MKEKQLLEIIDNVSMNFQGKQMHVFRGVHNNKTWIQVGMHRPDCDDPTNFSIGKSGKVYVSKHATEDEVVKKLLGLALGYVEHEMREGFYYKNKRLFGPHININSLMTICDDVTRRK